MAPAALGQSIDPPRYRLTPIGTLGGAGSTAWGINNEGTVVGSGNFDDTTLVHAYRWDDGVMTDLGTLGGQFSSARAVSENGLIGGWSQIGTDVFDHGARWIGEKIEDLTTLGGDNSLGFGINDAGDVVGRARDNSQRYRPVVWRSDGTPIDLGTLGGSHGEARGINNTDAIVGGAQLPSGDGRAFLWQGGVMTDLGTLGGATSDAYGINQRGVIVGSSLDAAGDPRAFVYTPGGLMSALASMGDNEEARAVNESDWIAGVSEPAIDSPRAALWIRDQVWDLNLLVTPGHEFDTLATATDINDHGQIIGHGVTLGGDVQGFLLTLAEPYLLGPEDPRANAINAFTVFGATPGQRSTFAYGFSMGSVPIPGCPGLTVDIRSPQIAGSATANSLGHATLEAFVPQAASGLTVYVQAVEAAACLKSNRIRVQFD